MREAGRVSPSVDCRDPWSTVHRSLDGAVNNSPRGIAQRRRIESVFGLPVRGKGVSDEPVHLQTGPIVQAVFSQNPAVNLQHSRHGGVKSDYDTAQNIIELHIEAGANATGTMMQDFLAALWEARATIAAGQARALGGVFMRPGGSQVLKMTMEMLGEAIGQGPSLAHARTAKANRRAAAIPLWHDPTGAGQHNDILDVSIAAEHLHYRDAMVGVAGIEMKPIGFGTSGGAQDMLANTALATAERGHYDAAILALRPFMSLAITINLATLDRVIESIERQIPFLKRLALKAKFLVNG